MASQQSPHNTSETASCSTPGYPIEPRKRKRSASESQLAREHGLMRDTGEHDAARFVGSGSGIHYIRAVHLRLARRSASRMNDSSVITTLIPGEDDQLRQASSARRHREQVLWKSNEVSANPENASPCFEDFVEWSKSYFESWHPVLPFLHGPEILRLFEEASKSGISSINSMGQVILKSVLSISLADSRQGAPVHKPIPKQLVFESVDDAVASSQFALSQPASIRSTQAALAIQLFLTSMLCLNAASRLGGLIVRMAFHMGLHRCPIRFPFFTAEEASVRRRVFWCIYSLERLLCQSLGLPLDIQDDDLDVCYPGEERHPTTGSTEDAGKLQLLTFVAKHARIRGLILELRNKSIMQRQETADRTAFVQTELAKWSNEIQDAVEEDEIADHASDVGEASPAISSTHKLMLLILKHEAAICLNRPGLASEYPSSSYSSAFQACISAAKSIFILLKKHGNRNRLATDSTGRRLQTPLLWPSFTWAVWISAFVLIHAAFENQVPLDSAMRHVVAGKGILSHLAARDTSWPEYCLGAIDELISAVQELSQARVPPLESPTDDSVTSHSRTLAARQQDENTFARTRRRETVTGWEQSATGRSNDPSGNVSRDLSTLPEHEANLDTASQHYPAGSSGAPLQGHMPWQQRHPQPHHLAHVNAQNGSDSQLGAPGVSRMNNGHDGPSFAASLGQADSNLDTVPVEGQESIMWYDQLFASSFSAIDNPFLVAAEFDASIDPTWNYLR
ncbi:Fungal-trans domain-containing protein [Fusarium keratoplasticum]|uniref:Fungal-trans domain-containing protein n=1 Tax=Fusarium keratoplasticum TaxID=1328300 RepID=A0ACC0RHX4_9HYPO|nr:Fungal-trans domain-containing protein [Fusarium keratoplasticum]KAI8685043.1 Fungal-trans domain-containing protein [Fusarium keratoplasticum]